LNFGKRGVSTSVGVRGAHVTFGKSGTRTTVGVPGTGLSYTHLERPHQSGGGESPARQVPEGRAWRGWLWMAVIVALVVLWVMQHSW
jgi:Protein of unknown function (DUF4236)